VCRRDREEDIIMVAQMKIQRKRGGPKEKVNEYSEGWHTDMWPLR